MDSTPITKNENETREQPTVRYVREVIINYRGRKKETAVMTSPPIAAEWIRKIIPDNSREHFVAVYLDAAHQMVGYSVVATGTANACIVHPREVFQRAILLGGTALIIGHNHPSGKSTPSAEDHNVTQLLKKAGELLGIRLLDHVIVGTGEHFSFSEHGNL